MNALSALSCVCLSALALPADRAVDELTFDPDAGSTATKTFREETSLSLEELEVELNGQEQPSREIELSVRQERRLVVADEVRQAADGRPLALRRAFREIGGSERVAMVREDAEREDEAPIVSELEGRAVVFTWDGEDSAYEVEFVEEDEDADPELLEGLWEDADLRALLPTGAVEVGGSWSVEPEALAPVLRPCGNVHATLSRDDVEGEDDPAEPLVMLFFLCASEAAEELEGALEGEVEARYEGTEDGIAVIRLEVDVQATRDVRDEMMRLGASLGLEDPQFTSMDEAEATYALRGEGTLRWDTRAQRAAGFELSGEVEASLSSVASMEVAAGESILEFTMRFGGRTEIELVVE